MKFQILINNEFQTAIDDSSDEIQALLLVKVIAIVHRASRSPLNLICVNIHAWSQTPTAKSYFYHKFSRRAWK